MVAFIHPRPHCWPYRETRQRSFRMGLSGTFALLSGEGPSRHGSLMYAAFHLCIAAVSTRFSALPGMYPAGAIMHGLMGACFLLSFAAAVAPPKSKMKAG